jgi:hypothetical protein
MTLAELCFIAAVVLFAVDALPMVGIPIPLKKLPLGLAFVALGLALGSGLAASLGVDGEII